MKIMVQKFGGTSLSSEDGRNKVSDKIIEKYKEGYQIVAVVSAMGRKGSPYATDTLLSMVNPKIISNREIDLLMSCGEIISAVVLANHLYEKGYDAVVLTGFQAGILTDDNFGNAEIISVDSNNILKYLSKDNIVIVAGFQGSNRYGEITTLGRGGSDITAVALGKALKCNRVEIFTDVDGIMTADPNIVPNAKVLKKMCYSEVYQLAEDGAKVIHPKAVEMAQQSNVPLVVKNTYSDSEGTSVEEVNVNFINNRKELFNEKIITAITYKKGRVQVIISLNDDDSMIDKLMEEITSNHISLDLINFLVDKKIFTIDEEDKEKLISILDREDFDYEIVENCCKISAIGYKMRGVPGVMARIVKALSKENIKILQTSDSHNTIWCLIKEEDTDKALAALHNEFKLFE
ncbi:aspartate kinase [Clostridium sp. Cult3]|uniref:aspartate kinase n=1 Tax=Clostridium sp. Cult3 TaxID=2079004 RepID=UPI001F015060|nr:aspartate kinase [Clostridium sp. Cult3]